MSVLGSILSNIREYKNQRDDEKGAKIAAEQAVVLPKMRARAVTFHVILTLVAAEFGLKPSDVAKLHNKHKYLWARNACALLTREFTDMSFERIGIKFQLHHTSVLHGCRRARERMESDPEFRAKVEKLRAMIGGGK